MVDCQIAFSDWSLCCCGFDEAGVGKETMKSFTSDIRIVVIGEQNLYSFLRANKKTRSTIVNTPPTFRSDRTTLQAKFHSSVIERRLSV